MLKDYAQELRKIAGIKKPVDAPTAKDWQDVEHQMGVIFPDDYKRLISTFGEGQFGVGLMLRNPNGDSTNPSLSSAAVIAHFEPIQDLSESAGLPFYPDPQGAVIIGSIDRQDFLFRPKENTNRLTELVWLNVDTGEAMPLGMTISQFIHDLYLGKIKQDWAKELRDYFWRNGTVPLFSASTSHP